MPASTFPLGARRAIRSLFIAFLPLLSLQAAAQLVISEFRLRGPNGANDEFVVISNPGAVAHTVAGGGTGYALAASNGVARFIIPNGTVIPAYGSYLGVNSVGYSLASYPAGNGTTATGDATYTTDIPDNAGIALFNTSIAANFVLANRMDAVGSTSEANVLYKEGTGYPALVPFSIDYSFYRDRCGKGGSITTFGVCPSPGAFKDTNNNAADFVFVDTNGTSAGAGQRLGAPGPRNLSSPVTGGTIGDTRLDVCVEESSPPNRVRDFTSNPAQNSTFGTLDFRRTFTNNTGGNVTRLRFRVVDQTTFPAPSGFADLRLRSSTAVVVTVDRPPCGSGTSNVTVQGTTLEQPPSQPNGSAFNGTASAGTITLATPLANGASIDLRFLFGIQQTGAFKLGMLIEGLPTGGGATQLVELSGCTDACSLIDPPTDLNGDLKSDILYRNFSTGGLWRLLMSGFTVISNAPIYTEDLAWKVVGDGSANSGSSSLIWRHQSTGQVIVENYNGSGQPSGGGGVVYTEANPAWKLLHTPDIDGDGYSDLLWWNSSTGQVYVVLLQGLAIKAQGLVYTEPNTDWKIVAVGDMGGTGKANRLVWRNFSTGHVFLMTVNFSGGVFSQTGVMLMQEPNTSWKIIGAPDLNGDGKADILWRNSATGQVFGMLMNGNAINTQGFIYTEPNLNWKIVAQGDYNGDLKADLLWRNDVTGQLYMMQMNGLAISSAALFYTEANTNWHVMGPWEYGLATGLFP